MKNSLVNRAIYRFLKLKIARLIPDKIFLKIKYKVMMGQKLNLKNPQSFNEKLQWLKLYDRKPEYTVMADKLLVRDYIADKVGHEYLIPLLGSYDSFDEIDFDRLPDEFVLKPNHTSGDVFLCKDKSQINREELREEVARWLEKEYFWVHREWPYKNIKPKLMCEEFLKGDANSEIMDYKFMCFNGEPKCIFVCLNRGSEGGLNIDIYDTEWSLMDFRRAGLANSGKLIDKPQNFEKMLELSRILAKDVPFLRVDFYEVGDKLYIGELTFYPASGFEHFDPIEYDYILGEWLKLPM